MQPPLDLGAGRTVARDRRPPRRTCPRHRYHLTREPEEIPLYRQTFSRQNPGCIVFLVDRSMSMGASWANSGLTLADGAARAINRILLELCVKSTKEQGAPMRPYFYVGIYGYGRCPRTGGQGVESALPAPLAQRGIVPLPELADNPLPVREEQSVDRMPARARVPVWYEAAHGFATPMCAAIAMAGSHIYEWAEAFQDSFPPIVINMTDGLVTDSPYQGVDLVGWAARLTTVGTRDGKTLMLNAFLSAETDTVTSFPSSAANLPEPGPELFEMSSPLPEPMIRNARAAHLEVGPGARGFVFNADLATLVKFLEVGTRFDVRHG
jgi:hypothetical protein